MRHILWVIVLAPLLSFGQMPEGMMRYDPVGRQATGIENSGAHHGHIQPLNPFLERTQVLQTSDSLLLDTARVMRYSIKPVLDLGGGLSTYPQVGMAAVGAAGVHGALHRNNRWYLRGGYQMAYLHFPDHLEILQNRSGVIAGVGEANTAGQLHYAHYLTGAVGLRMGTHFSLEGGREKHFFGDGYRSAILSNNAAPFPYLRLTTKVWKLKYVNLWGAMQDLNPRTGERRNKFTAMHALSWNIGDGFNLSIYEAVVWQTEDLLVNRGFDFAYLNPLVFYRPVEFAKGSADNMLLGMSLRADVTKKIQVYSQLYFDEIKIDFLRARNGWWGNKFAIQLGVKGQEVFAKGHNFLSEFNITRPFTYTHGSVIQAYGHLGQSLAHPLGTNFAEWLTRNRYENDKVRITNTIIWAAYGLNSAGQNLGGNVFTSYTGPFRQFDNYMFQGERQTLLLIDTEIAIPVKESGLYCFVSPVFRKVWNNTNAPTDLWLMVGLRTNIVGPYRDF